MQSAEHRSRNDDALRFDGGSVSRSDLLELINRLPPPDLGPMDGGMKTEWGTQADDWTPQDIGGPRGGTPSDQPIDTWIGPYFGGPEGLDVHVLFKTNPSTDHMVTQRMSDALENIVLGEGEGEVRSLLISSTTDSHKSGDHPLGDAIDISVINGVHVTNVPGPGFTYAQNLEGAAMLDPNVRFVEGPAGIFARDDALSDWHLIDKNAVTGNYDPRTKTYNSDVHVHISVFATAYGFQPSPRSSVPLPPTKPMPINPPAVHVPEPVIQYQPPPVPRRR